MKQDVPTSAFIVEFEVEYESTTIHGVFNNLAAAEQYLSHLSWSKDTSGRWSNPDGYPYEVRVYEVWVHDSLESFLKKEKEDS